MRMLGGMVLIVGLFWAGNGFADTVAKPDITGFIHFKLNMSYEEFQKKFILNPKPVTPEDQAKNIRTGTGDGITINDVLYASSFDFNNDKLSMISFTRDLYYRDNSERQQILENFLRTLQVMINMYGQPDSEKVDAGIGLGKFWNRESGDAMLMIMQSPQSNYLGVLIMIFSK